MLKFLIGLVLGFLICAYYPDVVAIVKYQLREKFNNWKI